MQLIPDESPCTIALDAMGGDFGPSVIVEAAHRFVEQSCSEILLVGDPKQLTSASDSIKVVPASEVVEMHESPSTVVRTKPQASIRVAFQLLRNGGAQAVVSTGNSGAMMVAGIMELGTIKGIARPAIAALLPRLGRDEPVVLLDSGANVDCSAHQLLQFALMGSHYARLLLGDEQPRVALLSNGTEESKGNDVLRAASRILAAERRIQFIGYIEANEVMRDRADVVVCDGFTGNVMLKAAEGTAHVVREAVEQGLRSSLRGRMGLALAAPILRKLFRGRFDPAAYGGAPLLGLEGLAIVCHGASNSNAVLNALRVAERCHRQRLVRELSTAIELLEAEMG
ncbi:MAG: phosphate acyltransferase PlsX [Bdellovibrionota bacterium]|nr:MAG: phosphate acyltransferase PlsX [Bdellovibrionota bacterium]